MKRQTLLIFLTVLVLAYITTSIGFWLAEDSFSTVGRIFLYETHKKMLRGVGVAPNQYRYLPYPLVEYFFKHIPIRWYSSTYTKLERWLGFDTREFALKSYRRNIDAFFPPEEREKFAEDLEKFLSAELLKLTKNPVVSNLILSIANNFGWKNIIIDPVQSLRDLAKEYPTVIVDLFDNRSDLNKVVNGYATMRFAFTFLLLLILYLWMKLFVSDFTAYVSLFAYSVFLTFGYGDFAQYEFLLSVFLFLVGLIVIHQRKPWPIILMLVIVQSFARTDHAFFTAVIYSLYNLPLSRSKFLKQSVLVFIPILITFVLSKIVFSNATYYVEPNHIVENIHDPWAFVYPMIFLSLPLSFAKKIGESYFFKKTWLWMILFGVVNFFAAMTREIRLFLPVMAYLFPIFWCGVESLYNKNEK